eukprot:TRINITY_DN8584_c0_g1_i1.p1 TRINITY_DN8584_c0_g1~~TRINITY_DN8584_c0_g1_i1.p1  ORF type:complete len:283 (-),score=26.64 TRINITY_DN8584_c0_g1_i1:45-863(-)
MACLSYKPSAVACGRRDYTRAELFQRMDEAISKARAGIGDRVELKDYDYGAGDPFRGSKSNGFMASTGGFSGRKGGKPEEGGASSLYNTRSSEDGWLRPSGSAPPQAEGFNRQAPKRNSHASMSGSGVNNFDHHHNATGRSSHHVSSEGFNHKASGSGVNNFDHHHKPAHGSSASMAAYRRQLDNGFGRGVGHDDSVSPPRPAPLNVNAPCALANYSEIANMLHSPCGSSHPSPRSTNTLLKLSPISPRQTGISVTMPPVPDEKTVCANTLG